MPYRLDVTDGWHFLMRVYRPGASVLDGTYELPRPEPLKKTRSDDEIRR